MAGMDYERQLALDQAAANSNGIFIAELKIDDRPPQVGVLRHIRGSFQMSCRYDARAGFSQIAFQLIGDQWLILDKKKQSMRNCVSRHRASVARDPASHEVCGSRLVK
jgi:hypothetical protein